MCGIAGIHLRTPGALTPAQLETLANALLREIDTRGGDATGFVARSDSGEIRLQRASVDAFVFTRHRRPFPDSTRTVLLHTRFATQGAKEFPENNHPVYAGDTYCTHNGVIVNDSDIFHATKADRLGEVDSEAIPVMVESLGWDHLSDALARIEGAMAIGLLNGKTGELALARGFQNPLVYFASQKVIVWASTSSAILRAWSLALGTPPFLRKLRTMQEGELLRANGETIKSQRFVALAPSYVSKWTVGGNMNTWWKGKTVAIPSTVTPADDVPDWGSWLDDPTDVRELDDDDDPGRREERCASCMDWFPRFELWDVIPGFPVCLTCERHFSRADATAEGVSAS